MAEENKTVVNPTTNMEINFSTLEYEYNDFVNSIKLHVTKTLKSLKEINGEATRLFVANPTKLYKQYLDSFQEGPERQHFTCNTCGRFFKEYGSLVYIRAGGKMVSLIWSPEVVPAKFKPLVQQLKKSVESSYIIGVKHFDEAYNSAQKIIYKGGAPEAGGFRHFNIAFNSELVMNDVDETYEQSNNYIKMAERLLTAYDDETLDHAVSIAKSGDLHKENAGETIEMFKDISLKVTGASTAKKTQNTIWAIAYKYRNQITAFNNSVYNRLLDNIFEHLDDNYVVNDFNRMVDPINYKRPNALPTENQVKIAEKIISDMGLEDSLKRTILKFEDLPESGILWKAPVKRTENNVGVFSGIKTKESEESKQFSKYSSSKAKCVISFKNFLEKVLPEAISISVLTETGPWTKLPFIQYTTAAVFDAPPIIKWDKNDARNPISCYAYKGNAFPSQFNLTYAKSYDVIALVVTADKLLSGEYKNGITAVIKNCYDTKYAECGSALFPDILIPELYDSRKVIEQYSNTTHMAPVETVGAQFVAGLAISFNNEHAFTLRVETKDFYKDYKIVCAD